MADIQDFKAGGLGDEERQEFVDRGLADREALLDAVRQSLQRINRKAMFCIEVSSGVRQNNDDVDVINLFKILRKEWLDLYNDEIRIIESEFAKHLAVKLYEERSQTIMVPIFGEQQ